MPALFQDLRHALRSFAHTPTFTFAALLSLAMGVGANSAIFSVASALFLRPLPYPDADRLVILWNRSPGLGIAEDWFSTAQYFDVKHAHQGFEEVAIAIGGNDNLTGDGSEPERIGTIRLSSNLLPMLGARAELGRLFNAADDEPGAPGVAVVDHGTWLRRYGADPAIIGRRVVVNGQPYQIVGVLPRTFSLPREVMPTLGGAENAEIVLPLPLGAEAQTVRSREDYNIVAKLRPGVSSAEAQAEMDGITARLRHDHPNDYPPNGGLTFSIVPLHEQVVGDVRQPVFVLVGAVAFVLLIACANVANLLLSRAVGRRRELALRAAIGATRGRLVRQLLTESLVLASGGGVLGLLLAGWSLGGIQALGVASVPRVHDIGIDGTVLLFTLAVSIGSGVVFGLAPAWRMSGAALHGALQDASRGSGAGALWGRREGLRRLLVVAEVALAVVLLAGAGLLVRSFAHVQGIAPGFNPLGTLTLELTMNGRKYGDANAILEAYRQVWERLGHAPGVTAAGGVSALPLSQMFSWGPITVEGRMLPAGEAFINVDQRMIGGDYFRAMEIPLTSGRVFSVDDTREHPRVGIVDSYMADTLWPGESPVGRRIRLGLAGATTPWVTIVGVVGRVKQYALDTDSRMALYLPQTQFPVRAMNVVLRSAGDPAAFASAVREALRQIDPDLPMYNVRTMTDRVDDSLARRRFSMLLLSLLAGVALALAALGVYGVLAYLVSQGTRDVGIRLALGATPGGIQALVIRQGMSVAAIGLALGLAAALALTRFLSSLLSGVAPTDAPTFAAIALILTLVCLTAIALPARRAARVDPTVALRAES